MTAFISQGWQKSKWNRKDCSAVTQAQKDSNRYLIFLVTNTHFHYLQNWHHCFSTLHLTFNIFHLAFTFILFIFSNILKIVQWAYLGYVFMFRTPMLVYGICTPFGPNRFDLGAVGSAQTTLTGWGFFMHLLVGGMPKRTGRRCQRSTTREIWAAEILRYIIKTKYFGFNPHWGFQIRV